MSRPILMAVFGVSIVLTSSAFATESDAGATFPWVSLANLLLLVVILTTVGWKSLRQWLAGRRTEVEKAVTEAEELRVRAERLAEEYRSKLAALGREVETILKEARETGERECERILERARVVAERIREDAQRSAEAEWNRGRKKLEEEVLGTAAVRAAEMLRSRVTEEDHRRFTGELLAKLEKMHEPGR